MANIEKHLSTAQKRTPKQQRSVKTVERIKKAALTLLEESGYSSFTLNKVATQASVNVATVYSYFPNKHNLLAVLTQEQLEERIAHLKRVLAEAGQKPDWVSAFCECLTPVFAIRAAQWGSFALRQAMRASPEIWRLDQSANEQAAEIIAEFLSEHQQTTLAQARLQGRLIAEAVTAIIDLTETLDDAEKQLAERELHKMIRGYLTGCREEA